MERLTYKIAPEVVNHDAEDGANFQEVINKLGEYEDTGLTPERMLEIDKLYTEKCREVAELKKKLNKQWISVNDELPKYPGEYLVSYHPCHWDIVQDKLCVGVDSFRGKTTWARKKYQRVVAWMPLPEPYKAE